VALQDTAASPAPTDRPGLGVAWIRQFVPFHRSASDTVALVPPEALRPPAVLIVVAPTAVQADGAVQDTVLSWLRPWVAGLGLGRNRQAVPFHVSASVSGPPTALK